MTTAKSLIVQTGQDVYALLLETIDKIVLPTPGQLKEMEGKKMLHWETEEDRCMVGVRQISELMHYNRSNESPHINSRFNKTKHSPNPLLLIRSHKELWCLEVEEILAEQELVIRPVSTTITAPKYVCGCSILGDGALILAIDGAVLVQLGEEQVAKNNLLPGSPNLKALPGGDSTVSSQHLLAPSVEKTTGDKVRDLSLQKRVLVVDDAISIRKTLSLTLEKNGYQVFQAEDGVDALQQLRQNPEVGVIVCDLEMPRMNGFEVLNNIASDPTLANIPVVILTSRNNEKHQRLARELGARAYFTKPYPEAGLIDKLTELIGNNRAGL